MSKKTDNITDFYGSEIADKGYFASEQDFRDFVSDENNAREFYNSEFKDKGYFGSDTEFLDFVKKKSPDGTLPNGSTEVAAQPTTPSAPSGTGIDNADKSAKINELQTKYTTLVAQGQKDGWTPAQMEEYTKGVKKEIDVMSGMGENEVRSPRSVRYDRENDPLRYKMDEVDIEAKQSSITPNLPNEVKKQQAEELKNTSPKASEVEAANDELHKKIRIAKANNEAKLFDQRNTKRNLDAVLDSGDERVLADAAVDDYIDFLSQTDENTALNYRTKVKELKEQGADNWSSNDQKFMHNLGMEATDIAARAEYSKLDKMMASHNFESYNGRMSALGVSNEKLSKEISEYSKKQENNPLRKEVSNKTNELKSLSENLKQTDIALDADNKKLASDIENFNNLQQEKQTKELADALNLRGNEITDRYKKRNEFAQSINTASGIIQNDIDTLNASDPIAKGFQERAKYLEQQYALIEKETGVNNDVISEYSRIAQKAKKISGAFGLEKADKRYSDHFDLVGNMRNEQMDVYDQLESEGFEIDIALRQAGSAVVKGVLSLTQLPKVFGDMTGDTDYDMFDDLYDFSQNLKDHDYMGASPQKGLQDLHSLSLLSQISVIGGQAAGSLASLALGGGSIAPIAKAAGAGAKASAGIGTFVASFVMTEADMYQEAIDGGMSPQQAGISATAIGIPSALMEMIIPDSKYLDDIINGAKKELKAGAKAGEGAKSFTKRISDGIVTKGKYFLSNAPKETLEEFSQTGVEHIGKDIANNMVGGDKEYFQDLYKLDDYKDAGIGALAVTGAISLLIGSKKTHSPTSAAVIRDIAENGDAALSKLAEVDPEAYDKAKLAIGGARQALDALKSHSNWSSLSESEQNHSLALTQQIAAIEEEQKKIGSVRLEDKAKDEEIKKIEEELNSLFNEKKEAENKEGAKGSNVSESIAEGQAEVGTPVNENSPTVVEESPLVASTLTTNQSSKEKEVINSEANVEQNSQIAELVSENISGNSIQAKAWRSAANQDDPASHATLVQEITDQIKDNEELVRKIVGDDVVDAIKAQSANETDVLKEDSQPKTDEGDMKGEASNVGVEDVVEPKKQNFTQFASENGYPDDYDTSFQAQLLGGRGLEGKRQSNRSIKEQDDAFQEMQNKKSEGKKAYEQAILDGKVIDPDGKLTREGILKRDYDFNKKELESKIASAESGIKNIDGLGKMAHLDNGKLKKGYQRAVDDYNETISKHKEALSKLKTEYEQSLKETTKAETPTPKGNTSNVGGDVKLGNNTIIADMSLPFDSGVNTGLIKNSKGAIYHDRNTAKLEKLGYSKEQIDNLSQTELNEILAKNIENPNVATSAKFPISEEQITTQDFLNEASKDGGRFAELAKVLKQFFGIDAVKTEIVKGLKDFFGKNNDGDYANNKIRIDEKAKNKLQTFLHEAIHKVTVDKLLQFERGDYSKLSKQDIEAIQNLIRIFNESKVKIHEFLGGGKGDRTKGHYGFTNVHEFISEAFTNPEFQSLLINLPTEGKNPTIFKQFLDAVAKFLGLKDASILNDIFYHTENLREQSLKETPKAETPSSSEIPNNSKEAGVEGAVNSTKVEVEPPTETGEPNFEAAEGERRQASRSKRIEEQQEYKDKLEDYTRTYRSVNTKMISSLVSDYFSGLRHRIANGESAKKVLDEAWNYADSLIKEDAGLSDETNRVFTKSAFALMLGQKSLEYALETGNTDIATKWNNAIESIGRNAGTLVALQNAGISLDPLQNLFNAIVKEQEKALDKPTKSGRKKKDVAQEIREETEKAKAESVDEAVDSKAVEAVTTTVSQKKQEPKPVAAKTQSKRAKLKTAESEAIAAIKKIFADKTPAGPLMAVTPKNTALAKAIINLAKIEIQLGAYTTQEAIAATYKKVKDYVSKKQVSDILNEEWANLQELADTTKKEDALELIKEAITGSSNTALRTIAKAMRMVKPDFIKQQMKGKRMTEKQVLEEILSDKAQTEEILRQAMELLKNEVVVEGKHIDIVKSKKPADMTDAQWNSLRGKYVIAQFQKFVDSVIGNSQSREQEMIYAEWIAAKDAYEAAKENKANKYEEKERERIAKAELAEAEKNLKEVEAAYKKDEKEKENWIKAKDRHEAAKNKLREEQDEKQREKIANEALAAAQKEAERTFEAYSTMLSKAVKKVAKQFYKEVSDSQSLAEALINEIPSLTLDEALRISGVIETEMKRLVDMRDQRRIKELVNEMTDGKEDADVMKVIAKSMWNRGAMSSFQFNNNLANFLGFKGIPPNVINMVTRQMQVIAAMPNGIARQIAIQKVNSVMATYTETVWSNLSEVMDEVMVRNILSGTKTAFTGGLSVFLLTPVSVIGNVFIRPFTGGRALKLAGQNFVQGRNAMRAAARNTFIEHGVPVSRELPTDDNAFSKNRAWVRARKETWKEVAALWKVDKGKAIGHTVGKLLIKGTFQGKHLGITNLVNDLQIFLDYMNLVGLRDMYAAIDAQRATMAKGIKPNDPAFNDTWKGMMSMNPTQLAAIEQQVDAELAQMANSGQPIPKGFKSIRTKQLISENSETELLAKAHEKAIQAMGMGEPTMLATNVIYSATKLLDRLGKPSIEGQMGFMGFVTRRLLMPVTLFMRMALVLGEKGFRMTPLGVVTSLIPVRWTYNEKTGFSSIKRDAQGNVEYAWNEDPRAYAARAAAASLITAGIVYFLSVGWDDEEVLEKDGTNPDGIPKYKVVIDPLTGKPLIRQVYKLGNIVDFYGGGQEVKGDIRGTDPRNVVRIMMGHNEDGTPKYNDIPMEAFTPFMYGNLKALGQQRDAERYLDEQIRRGIDKGTVYNYLKANSFTFGDIAASAAANSWNLDFQAVNKLIKSSESENLKQGAADLFIFDNTKSLTNPTIAKDITKQVEKINGMHEIYIGYKMKDDGMGGLTAHLMKDVWFTDPFIADRKNFESIDPFGNPIEYPPLFSSFLGMFGTTTTYKMAEHEQRHKEFYNLYKNESGQYDPLTLAYPKRYLYSTGGEETIGDVTDKVTIDKDLRRKISDEAYIQNGKLLAKNLDKLKAMPYEKRAKKMAELWKEATKLAREKYDIESKETKQ